MLIYTVPWKDCVQYLKSGMPVDVLIPAPECTTMYCDSFIHWANVSTLVFSSSGLSNSCKHTHFRLMTCTASRTSKLGTQTYLHKVTNGFKLLFFHMTVQYLYCKYDFLHILENMYLAELLASGWTYNNLIIFVNPPLFLLSIHFDLSIYNSNHQ